MNLGGLIIQVDDRNAYYQYRNRKRAMRKESETFSVNYIEKPSRKKRPTILSFQEIDEIL
ncbi:MAG: hypothetical protein K8F34_06890 [Candidatus Kuenenia stuttgartiensis]|uniref:hypothetical protein n=1 Tax=Kuenenia stuttgartiensis TaxID=174633 RepID=UPI000C07A9AA|nr:hypothetical protein [Candidatus Kuenenia stuttgartiensis]MBZ0191403.1 hypothetical protein [Candidatus Kuenenia stuttgartiensis]GJQ48150.1 MAG: hypothetical protein HKUEN01_05360 [Candidatus Kuenenia stuttgartiensis]